MMFSQKREPRSEAKPATALPPAKPVKVCPVCGRRNAPTRTHCATCRNELPAYRPMREANKLDLDWETSDGG